MCNLLAGLLGKIVLDWYSKKIVGYKLNIRSKSDDWIEALNMADDNNCLLGSREYVS
ncbi:MAG: hypothetical protein ACUVT3_11840 [Ignavibacterium sp.]